MSNSDATAGLRARADDPTTEIFLMDGTLERLASGVGVLEWRGRPGLYKVRFRAGRTQEDVLVELSPGPDPMEVNREVFFSTPVPLRGTTTSHEYHQAAAQQLSRSVDATLGSGSALLVLARDYDLLEDDEGPVCAGLTLHHADGRPLYDFARGHTVRVREQAAWGGAHLQVDPGAYRLRLRLDDDRVLEQTIVACGGWTTQVFLARAAESGESAPRPDLMGAAVLMTPAGEVFDVFSEAARWTEMLRRALESGRPGVPTTGEPLERVLRAGKDSPMLGLLAAHLLLAGGPASAELARRVADDLHPALAGHPDAVALRLALSPDEPAPPLTVPPMLRSSWAIALRASGSQPGLIPPGSLAERVASRVVSSGAWTVWMLPEDALGDGPDPAGDGAGEPAGAMLEMDRLGALVAGSRHPGALHPHIDPSLTPEEANLLRLLWLRVPVPQAAAPAPAPVPKRKKRKSGKKDPELGALGGERGSMGSGGMREDAGPVLGSLHGRGTRGGAAGGAFGRADRFEKLAASSGLHGHGDAAEEAAGFPPAASAPVAAPVPAPGIDEMVQALQLPAGSVHAAARGLLEKLSGGTR
ncbi:MAG TPA: hypothetical protein VLK84_09030 [Longimicrobium sp.]|nr:hypothetical protein [Longimicrobium sp.]